MPLPNPPWRCSSRAWIAALGLLVLAAPAVGQSIAGTIREANGGPLISGGFVSLIDAAGEVVQADFTAADGAFTLAAPGPGEYRVRVERIGYENWLTDVYTLESGGHQTVLVEIPPEPVSLVDLRVEVTRSCLDDPTQGAELARVWEEARKALESAVWAEQRGEVSFTLTEYDRTLEPGSLATREAESRTRHGVRLPPFESVPVGRLIESGFAVITEDTATYYAPDAAVLLSEAFQNTHCFGLRRTTLDDTSVLGITFQPRNSRPVVEIEGTLWVDEATAELLRVQLLYRNVPLPRGADRRFVGADLEFERLPDGPFYVREWWIRFPVAGTMARVGMPTSADRTRAILVAYKQTGGAVTNAFVGARPLGDGAGIVRGVVHDSVDGGPLAGAEVVMRDWNDAADFLPDPDPATAPFAAVTDAAGAFALAGVPDGAYAVRVDHPRLRAAGLRLSESRVTVEDARTAPLDLATPSMETIYERVCPDSRTDKPRGAIVGFVRHPTTGVPLPGVVVEALWRVESLRVSPSGETQTSNLSEGADAVADPSGRFVVCDVPVGESVRLRPSEGGEGVVIEQKSRVVWEDVFVDP